MVSAMFYVFSVILCFFVQGNAQPFPAPTCPSTHTNCLTANNTCINSRSYNPFANTQTSKPLQDYIVALHNLYRSKIAGGLETRGMRAGPQPRTECMNRLAWDADLATTAQRWADQCVFTSDTNRDRTTAAVPNAYVGQNIFGYVDPRDTQLAEASFPETDYFTQAIRSWFDEVRSFNPAQTGAYVFSNTNGHYSQAAWGRTVSVGCGMRRWQLLDGTTRYARILVCNYWPGGNYAGQPVYVPSTANAMTSPSCSRGTCGDAMFTGRTLRSEDSLCA